MISGKNGIRVALALVLFFSFSLADCSRKAAEPGPGEQMTQPRAPEETPDSEGALKEVTPPAGEEPLPGGPETGVSETARRAAAPDASDLVDVFFAFDRWGLTPEVRDRLAGNAALLRADPDARITIEGHCDERGTSEYNLGLGERRADAVRDYLVSLGVSASRIRTISYGEEKPFAAGHNEAAWKLNRRAHFSLR